MDAPESTIAIRDAIRHWSRLTALAEFAVERHGYGNTDGGFAVEYPDDLDEYAREVEVSEAGYPAQAARVRSLAARQRNVLRNDCGSRI